MKRKMSLVQKVNILRASVMGANDGIISVAGIVIGVAAATQNPFAILISGLAGSLAGTISMAAGEYISVSTQKDSQKMALAVEGQRLKNDYASEFSFVKQKYLDQSIDPELAQAATQQLMDKDPIGTVVQERYGFNPREYTSPYDAAIASFISFPIGSILPIVAVTISPVHLRIWMTMLAVTFMLIITGYTAAVLGGSDRWKSAFRNVIAGLITMLITFVIGQLFAH